MVLYQLGGLLVKTILSYSYEAHKCLFLVKRSMDNVVLMGRIEVVTCVGFTVVNYQLAAAVI